MNLHERSRVLVVNDTDFGLTAAERITLREHLATCTECRRFGEGVQSDAAWLARLAAEPSTGASPAVRDHVLAAAAGKPETAWRLLVQMALLAALAALLLAVGGLLFAGATPRLDARVPTRAPVAASSWALASSIDTAGRLPPEPDYCVIGLGDHRSPDCRIGLTAGADSIWVDAGLGVARVDPQTDGIVAAIPLPSDPRDLVFLGDVLYAATENGVIAAIDPVHNVLSSTIPVASRPLAAMVDGGNGRLWVTIPKHGSIALVDTASRSVLTRVRVGGEPFDIAVAGDSVWVTDRVNARITRVDAASGTVIGTTPLLAFEPRDVEATSAGLWVVGSSEVALIDPATGRVIDRVAVPATANMGLGSSGPWLMAIAKHAAGVARPAGRHRPPAGGPAHDSRCRGAGGGGHREPRDGMGRLRRISIPLRLEGGQ